MAATINSWNADQDSLSELYVCCGVELDGSPTLAPHFGIVRRRSCRPHSAPETRASTPTEPQMKAAAAFPSYVRSNGRDQLLQVAVPIEVAERQRIAIREVLQIIRPALPRKASGPRTSTGITGSPGPRFSAVANSCRT